MTSKFRSKAFSNLLFIRMNNIVYPSTLLANKNVRQDLFLLPTTLLCSK